MFLSLCHGLGYSAYIITSIEEVVFSLPVRGITKKLLADSHEVGWKGITWPTQEPIQFRSGSES